MKKIKTLAATLMMIFAFGAAHAQMVSPTGLGVRLTPDGGGFTGKFFLDKNLSIEAQLNGSAGYNYTAGDGPSMTMVGLVEYNVIFPNPSWRLFLGPGLHLGTWDRQYYGYYDGERNVQGIFGIDAIVGMEYIFKSVPIGLSADIKPAMNFASDVAFFPNNFFGLSARYYVGHRMFVPRHAHPVEQ